MSGIAFRPRSLRSRLCVGRQIRSGVRQLHWCRLCILTRCGPPHIGRTQRDGRCVRSWCAQTTNGYSVFYMCPFLYGWVGHLQWRWTKAGAWSYDDRSLTLPPSMYPWRCTNIAACRYGGLSGESTGSAISHPSLRTATWRQSHWLLRNPRRNQQPAANFRWV